MALNFCSNWVNSRPLFMFTAPNKPIDFRVGARSWIGSVSSGGTHILILEPCCWKWHSSKLHNSIVESLASFRRFFKILLLIWIRFRNQRARFSKPKTQVPENTLALPDSQIHSKALSEMMREEFSIPKVLLITQFTGMLAKILAHRLPLFHGEPPRSARSFEVSQSSKPVLFKVVNPALNCRRMLSKQFCNLITAQASADKQNSMKSVIITGFLRTRNFLLNCDAHNISVRYLKLFHDGALLEKPPIPGGRAFCKYFMLQYLCRYV